MRDGAPAIELAAVGVRARGRWLLREVSLSVGPGESFGVTGASGSGKSLLLSVCATIVAPDAGTLSIGGLDARRRRSAARRALGYAPVEVGCDPRATVREDLHFFANAYGIPRDARPDTVTDVMRRFGLATLADVRMAELSRGLARRVILARAWLHRPRVLLIDDPASGLDDDGCEALDREMQRHVDAGGALVVTSARLADLARWCGRTGVIDAGVLTLAERNPHIEPNAASGLTRSVARQGDA
jgi:ABC-2 type transport system ATP-binding protein